MTSESAGTNVTPRPLRRVVAIYTIAVPLAWLVTPGALPWEPVAALLAVAAVPVAGLSPWWLVINAVFLPGLAASLTLDIHPVWPLAALVFLGVVYGKLWKSRVPLFFSTARTQQVLAKLLPAGRPITFLDAGSGDGRVIARLADVRPESRFHGVEHALLPWLAARLRCFGRERQCDVRREDLWARDLAPYDVVYAFLSPAVMERFWQKARREMRADALLVSAYGVPDLACHECIETGDALGTQLHVWRMGAERRAA